MTVQQGSPHRQRTRPLWLYAVVGAFVLLALAVGVPAWASSTPADLQQGTVPPPPPDDSEEEEEEENSPSATATPAPEGQAPPVAVPTPAGTPSIYTGAVNAPRLNVRSGPGVNFAVLGRVFEGESLQILFRNPEGDWWYACCIAGTTTSGWVSAAFIAPDFDTTQALALIPVSDSQEGTP
ncbi:MAG: SH3 domain-containing protein, partial [Caldilineaceae bacterium]